DGDVAARVTQATIRHFTIRRTSAPGSRGVQMNGTPAMPATLDGVVVEADSGTLAVNADGASRVVNTLIDQKGGAGIGLGVSTFDGSPRIVNSSIFADGKALVVSYGYGYGASQVDLVNSLLHAPTDIVFSTVASNPSGSVTLATTASAYRPAVAPPGQFVTGSPVAFSDALISEAGAPLAGSTLIDAGISDPLSGSLDVAGKARVVGPAIDIGAFEFDPTAPTPTPAPTAAPAPTAVPVPTSVPTPVLAPVDVKKPSLTLEGSTKSLKRSKLAGKSGLELVAKVDEAATVGVELVVKSTKKGKTTERVLGSATTKTTAAGRAKLALKIKASKLGKGSLKATLRFTATDAAGNETLVERKTTVK
ncbi:MAG: choice-of-anchor Q domain-containing protein, partial [Solirubrobacteraceae bacterium]|nr:choice-of-anchor Q domain-containing protein [Solirubrobacteraceae bacterium]